ncbi:MAG: isochorismatase family protein, partial [Pirellulaceae bacterium]
FFGTHLAAYLIELGVDTLLITACSTSACIRSTATDAKSFRFRPVIISDCVGDRSAVAHVFTLADIQARFSDVVSLAETLQQLQA